MPTLPYLYFLPLAQSRIDAVTLELVEPEVVSDSRAGMMMACAFATIAIALAAVTLLKQRANRPTNDSGRLFLELCRANHLSRRQRKLLSQLSTVQQLTDPCQLLLNIELWQLDSQQAMQFSSHKTQAELLRLRSLLFTKGRHTPELELAG